MGRTSYEIRLEKPNEREPIVMMVFAASDDHAVAKARRMLRDGITNATIFRDGELIDTIYPNRKA